MKKFSKVLAAFLCICLMMGCIPAQAASVFRIMENHAMVEALKPRYRKDEKSMGKLSDAVIIFPEGVNELIIPMEITAEGLLEMQLFQKQDDGVYVYLEGDVYADKSCTEKLGISLDLVHGEVETAMRTHYFDAPGMVYLKLSVKRKVLDADLRFRLQSSLTAGGDRSLKQGNAIITAFDGEEAACSYQFTVKKAGYLDFSVFCADRAAQFIFTLKDAKGREISQASDVLAEATEGGYLARKAYMIGKGVYHMEVVLRGARADICRVSYGVRISKDESGRSMRKAATLSSERLEGAITQGAKVGHIDWYKLDLTEETRVVIEVDAVCDGRLRLQITDGSGEGDWFGSKVIVDGEQAFDAGVLSAGVYYVKMVKEQKKSGGGYYIALQQ